MPTKRVLILGNCNIVVFRFRREIIERLIEDGYEVIVSYPKNDPLTGSVKPEDFKCTFIDTSISRRGMNPLSDFNILKQYKKIIKQYNPNVVLAFTVKPDIYGGIICRKYGIPFVANITGAGGGLTRGGITSMIVKKLYKIGLKNATMVFFQNESDKHLFERIGVEYKNCKVLPGSGVNLAEYKPLPYPDESEPIRFYYVARVMREKGIEEFLFAAKQMKAKYKDKAEFHICGLYEDDYKQTLDEYVEKGIIYYHGMVSDVKEHEKCAHCIVLPSFHPEGISNVLLEAAAMARPIITTENVGCKETVDDGISGYVVRQKDAMALYLAVEKFFLLSYVEKVSMGIEGRRKIEKNFDRQIVVKEYSSVIESKIRIN